MTAQLFLLIMAYSLLAIIIGLLIYRALIKGYAIGIYLLLKALPGILFDVLHHIWLSVADLFPRRKKKDIQIELDEYERMLS